MDIQRKYEQGMISEEEFTKASEDFTRRIEGVNEKYMKRMAPPEKKAKGGPIYSHAEQDLLRRYSSR
jgi:hypothetical protein